MNLFYTTVFFVTLQMFVIKGLQLNKNQCSMTPCEVLEIINKEQQTERPSPGCTSDIQWRKLDRRLQAIEQPDHIVQLHRSLGFGRQMKHKYAMELAHVLRLVASEEVRAKPTLTATTTTDPHHRTVATCTDHIVQLHRSLGFGRQMKHKYAMELAHVLRLVASEEVRAKPTLTATTTTDPHHRTDLGTNKLRTLHKSTFKGMKSLTELDMFDNHVEFLPSGIFDPLINLKILRLQRNYLEEIDSEAFRYTKKLFHVDLSNNYLYTLPERLFVNNSYLETIDISNNQIVYMPSDTFIGLRSLLILDLSKNKIQKIENGTFTLKKLQILKLSDNKINNVTENAFDSLTSLETLLLDKNSLQNIPACLFQNLYCMSFLDLSSNRLVTLTGLEFQNLMELRNLDIKDNYISQLPDDLFLNCTNLEKLDLSKNKLRFLNYSAFDGLENLTTLILSENQIHEVHFKTFINLKNLTTLYLDNNMFPSLPSRTLDYMPKLANVKLSNNPWHCDCHALYISAWVRLNEMKIWDYSPTCVSPWYLEGHFLKKLKFPELCTGQWASMVNLAPRLPMQQLLALNVNVHKNEKSFDQSDDPNDSSEDWE